jgi:MFS transporter, FSR family, fosmidomycin resistance protein
LADAPVSDLVRPRVGGPATVLLLISGSHAVIHAYTAVMPLIYPLALVDLHFSLAALGVMVAVSNLAGGLLQLGAGALTRLTRRHTVIGWGAVLLGVSGIGTALAGNFAQFFAMNVVARAAASGQHPLGNSLLSDLYARSRRGMAIAAHVGGGNVGTLLAPAAGVLVVAWGWRRALLVLTIPAILAGVAILIGMTEAPGPQRERTAFRDMLAALHLLRRRNLALIFAAGVIGAGGRGLGIVALVIPLFLKQQLQLPTGTVNGLYGLVLVGSVVGTFAIGPISDWLGRRRTLLLSYALSVPVTVALVGVHGLGPWLVVLMAGLGLIVYGESPLLQTFVADEAPAAERDALFSLYFAVAFGVGSLWAAGLGVALERLGYGPVFLVMAVSYVAAAACVAFTREPGVSRQ